MVALLDILHKISFGSWDKQSDYGNTTNIELLQQQFFSLRFIITTNIEAAEERYYQLYGHGETYYFPLTDYEQGKALIGQLHHYLRLDEPKKFSDPEILTVGKKMFLFLFIQEEKNTNTSADDQLMGTVDK
ncbi:hypothetical protein [Taibaiella soli]|uniref:Uncharacterized protein n=1 Tax=Taibaiella soli TaxID=1649169 RepID=A0A2W2C3J2_9BACT|nr:hypothetical protein [Taibaiella soli]PZF74683.1 hypothetical protein DN068_00350 [Taibaiella soli]